MNKNYKHPSIQNQSYVERSSKECFVSKASKELMLHRISNGEDIDFPFNSNSNN
tara:strand:- start:7198 stop:7359 length:162 start_codon:yes stop_codon:yes gene_type:complete